MKWFLKMAALWMGLVFVAVVIWQFAHGEPRKEHLDLASFLRAVAEQPEIFDATKALRISELHPDVRIRGYYADHRAFEAQGPGPQGLTERLSKAHIPYVIVAEPPADTGQLFVTWMPMGTLAVVVALTVARQLRRRA